MGRPALSEIVICRYWYDEGALSMVPSDVDVIVSKTHGAGSNWFAAGREIAQSICFFHTTRIRYAAETAYFFGSFHVELRELHGHILPAPSWHGKMWAYAVALLIHIIPERSDFALCAGHGRRRRQQKAVIHDVCLQGFGMDDFVPVWLKQVNANFVLELFNREPMRRSVEMPVHEQARMVVWEPPKVREEHESFVVAVLAR
jgi:hypothetical protein